MAPEQVSALSDEKLNRAMIWLYPPKQGVLEGYGAGIISISAAGGHAYLTNYNQTMPLVVEHKIGMEVIPNGIWCAYHGADCSYSENYLRAACECLVLIALADK